MIDVNKAISTAVRTGKVVFGAESALQNAKTGKAKIIVLADNCPERIRKDIEHHCKLSDLPFLTFRGTSLDLAAVCGKPFIISALSIREPGDSEILKLIEKSETLDSFGGSE